MSSDLPSVFHITIATGSLFAGCAPASGPDGGNPCVQGSNNHRRGEWPVGVHTACASFPAGVVLSDDDPITRAPMTLEFTDDGLGKSFDSLSSELAKIFFIGGRHTDGGDLPNFLVVTGTTRLVLGTIDNCGGGISAPGCCFDNVGGFDVTFPVTPVLLPGPAILLLTGLVGIGWRGVRRNKRGRLVG